VVKNIYVAKEKVAEEKEKWGSCARGEAHERGIIDKQ